MKRIVSMILICLSTLAVSAQERISPEDATLLNQTRVSRLYDIRQGQLVVITRPLNIFSDSDYTWITRSRHSNCFISGGDGEAFTVDLNSRYWITDIIMEAENMLIEPTARVYNQHGQLLRDRHFFQNPTGLMKAVLSNNDHELQINCFERRMDVNTEFVRRLDIIMDFYNVLDQ